MPLLSSQNPAQRMLIQQRYRPVTTTVPPSTAPRPPAPTTGAVTPPRPQPTATAPTSPVAPPRPPTPTAAAPVTAPPITRTGPAQPTGFGAFLAANYGGAQSLDPEIVNRIESSFQGENPAARGDLGAFLRSNYGDASGLDADTVNAVYGSYRGSTAPVQPPPPPKPTVSSGAGGLEPGVDLVPGRTSTRPSTPTTPTNPTTSRPTAYPSTVLPGPGPTSVTGTTTTITPPDAGSLEGDIYTPGGDPRLTGAQGATDRAASAVAGQDFLRDQSRQSSRYRSLFGTGAVAPGSRIDPTVTASAIDPNARFRGVNPTVTSRSIAPRVEGGPDVAPTESGRYGAEQDAAVAALSGPSRTELAKQALADFDTQGEQALAQRFRKVGQTAAKFGTLGLGDVNAQLGSIQGDYERDRLTKQNELARSVAEGDIGDRFRRVETTAGLRRGESGIESGLRSEARTERDYDTGLDERNVGRDFAERDFETMLASDNVGRARSERDAELGVDERNLGRRMDERDTATRLAADNYSRAAGERAYATDADRYNSEALYDRQQRAATLGASDTEAANRTGLNQFDAATSLEDRIAGQGRQNRDEFRTERGYQAGQTQNTLENRLRLRQQEEAEREAAFRRSLAQSTAGRA